jgi:helicase required for RNAi-mediated heterochromatin assembly 1
MSLPQAMILRSFQAEILPNPTRLLKRAKASTIRIASVIRGLLISLEEGYVFQKPFRTGKRWQGKRPIEVHHTQKLPQFVPSYNRLGSVQEYVQNSSYQTSSSQWLRAKELPEPEELWKPRHFLVDASETAADIPMNITEGAWPAQDDYLEAHWRFLREDSLRPLRELVAQLQSSPHSFQVEPPKSNCGIYGNVFIKGLTFSPTRGIAAKVTFSLRRVGKRVCWKQSKRLIPGSLVVLTPIEDQFRSKCVVAVVAARPLEGLQQSPPEIDLFLAKPSDTWIDPCQEWLMLEERSAYYEATRHTMVGLQRMTGET